MTMLLATINNSSGSNIASTLQHQIKQQQQQQQQQQQHRPKHFTNSNSNNNFILNSTAATATAAATSASAAETTKSTVMNGVGNLNGNSITTNGHVTQASETTTTTTAAKVAAAAEEEEASPEIDIVINNVVCSYSVRCHLNLREIALNGFNVEYKRENGMVTMKLRRPYTTASIWSSGRITCTGATSEDQAKIAARRYARCLAKLGFRVRFQNFRIVNVLGTCSMPWAIKIVHFSAKYKKEASYEPELHPGVTYKLKQPKATMKIFSTGSITVTAASVANVQAAIEHIFPLVYEFRKQRTPAEIAQLRQRKINAGLLQATPDVVDETLNDNISAFDNDAVVTHSPPNDIISNTTSNVAAMPGKRIVAGVGIGAGINPIKSKRRRLATNGDSDDVEEDADDPAAAHHAVADAHDVVHVAENDDDVDEIIMFSEFDDPEDLIEGPDDEYDTM